MARNFTISSKDFTHNAKGEIVLREEVRDEIYAEIIVGLDKLVQEENWGMRLPVSPGSRINLGLVPADELYSQRFMKYYQVSAGFPESFTVDEVMGDTIAWHHTLDEVVENLLVGNDAPTKDRIFSKKRKGMAYIYLKKESLPLDAVCGNIMTIATTKFLPNPVRQS